MRGADRSSLWRVPSVEGVDAFSACFTSFAYARHSHASYAFGTIDEGAMQFWHGGGVHRASRGEVIAINPGEVHDGRSGSPEGCRYRMLYVERAAIEQSIESDAPRIREIFALSGPVLRDEPLAQCVRQFHQFLETERDDPHLSLERQTRLIQVLSLLFSRYGRPRLDLPGALADRRCVGRAKEYLMEHLGEPVRLSDLAHAVRLSPFHLLRTFKLATGMAPHGYLNQLRLERAKFLLRRGEPLADIAAALGFVDQSHFTRRFKAAFGVTPGQYAGAQGLPPRGAAPAGRNRIELT